MSTAMIFKCPGCGGYLEFDPSVQKFKCRYCGQELSEEELRLLHLYRKSRTLPQKMRTALRETLETTINLYIATASELKTKSSVRKKNEPKLK